MRETPADQTEAFDQHRKMLFSIAYRMLGSISDAEGMVSSLSEQRLREAPPRLPNGVRTASRITASAMMGAPLFVYDRECNPARMLRIVEYPLAGDLGARRVDVAFAGVQVALPTGKRA
jgi:hypothetical protein